MGLKKSKQIKLSNTPLSETAPVTGTELAHFKGPSAPMCCNGFIFWFKCTLIPLLYGFWALCSHFCFFHCCYWNFPVVKKSGLRS